MEQFATHFLLTTTTTSRSQIAASLVLLLVRVQSFSCAPALSLSTSGAGFRSSIIARCGEEAAAGNKSCCCCCWRRSTSSRATRIVAQDLKHRECKELCDIGHGNATTSPGGTKTSNSGAFKRKASATIIDDDDDPELDRDNWWAYLLLSADSRKTYVGVSSNVVRRLRQHNGELAGGAKAARAGRPWHLACTVGSFRTRSEACRFEWRWKKFSKSSLGMDKAVAGDLPLSAPPKKLVELPVILRRWTALMKTQNEVQQWKQVQVDWHSEE